MPEIAFIEMFIEIKVIWNQYFSVHWEIDDAFLRGYETLIETHAVRGSRECVSDHTNTNSLRERSQYDIFNCIDKAFCRHSICNQNQKYYNFRDHEEYFRRFASELICW